MKILFSEISPLATRYRLDVVTVPVVSGEFHLREPIDFRCTLAKKSCGGITLEGEITASLLLRCDRCLDMVSFQVHSGVSLSFAVGADECRQGKNIELPADDLDIIEISEPVIDLEEIAVQQLDYNLPVKYLCDAGCMGICSACGVNLNNDACRCFADTGKNPFAILAELKK